MGPGGDSGAKEGLIRECDCSGSAPGVLFGPIWRPFRGHFGPKIDTFGYRFYVNFCDVFFVAFGAFWSRLWSSFVSKE